MHKVDLNIIEKIVKPIIEQMDFRLYDLDYNEVSRTLKVYVDRENGGVTIKDCEVISNSISDALDAENVIDFEYTLEVSSPGIERFLTKPEHFQWATGKMAEITLRNRRLKGYIRTADAESVTIAQDSEEVVIQLSDIIKAKISEEIDYGKRR